MFNKCEKKKSVAPVFLTIGALAVIGALSITKCGKKMMCCIKSRINTMMSNIGGEG